MAPAAKATGTPERFAEAAKVSAPSSQVRILAPGERLTLTRGAQ
jgi:hypothetical protein